MCQKVYRMYHFFPEKMESLGGGKKEMGKNLILSEKESIYYWKIKLGHTEQIWGDIIWTAWKRFWGNETK